MSKKQQSPLVTSSKYYMIRKDSNKYLSPNSNSNIRSNRQNQSQELITPTHLRRSFLLSQKSFDQSIILDQSTSSDFHLTNPLSFASLKQLELNHNTSNILVDTNIKKDNSNLSIINLE